MFVSVKLARGQWSRIICLPAPERVVVLNDAARALGGATSLALTSALGARGAGLEVAFITAEGEVDPRLENAGIRVVQIPGRRISAANRIGTAAEGLWRTATLDAIRGEIERFDSPRTIYHLHNWQHFLSPSAFLALGSVADRLLISTHDQFLACPNGAQYNFNTEQTCGLKGGSLACGLTACDRRSRVDKAWRYVRHLVRSAAFDLRKVRTRILLLHEMQRDIFIRAGVSPDRLHVVRNPAEAFVQGERVPAEANSEAIFVGRMAFEKGADLAARAAAQAGVRMRFLGDGPLRAKLAAEFPAMSFDGHVDRASLSAAARRARLLVMPSRWPEPFGLVLPEALGQVCP